MICRIIFCRRGAARSHALVLLTKPLASSVPADIFGRMIPRCLILPVFLCALNLCPAQTRPADAETNFAPLALTGQTFIHDPSTIIKEDGRYYIFGTGPGIRTKSSPDLIHWENGDPVFRQPPAWTTKYVPTFKGAAWAPDVVRVNGKYFLYYAASTWQKPISTIGLLTSPTLNPSATNYFWQDHGMVIASTNGYAFNTIDPSALLDADGKLWLAFGSYWQGIFLTELDPQTGKRFGSNAPLFHLAWNHSIEAACLARHAKYYYLFVNWGQCCLGTNSTYEVRMGRADKVTGPYLDRDGKSLASGGGSVFLHSCGRFIGPGHIGIVDDGGGSGVTQFSYHYYDADTQGRSRLAVGKIDWVDDWPVPKN
jgi:arabinan endo-1,5-alpha-L-arabinosidase